MKTFEKLFRDNVTGIKTTNDIYQLMGLCPFHDDSHPSLSMNIQHGLWNCKACGESGNAYQFAKRVGLPRPNHYNSLSIKVASINDSRDKSKSTTSKVELGPVHQLKPGDNRKLDTIANILVAQAVSHIDLLPSCWDIEIVKDMQIGFAKGKLYFTHHDENGQVVAIHEHRGGVIGDGRSKWYLMHQLKVYDREKKLYICEGEKDAITLRSIGLQATSVTTGCNSIPKGNDGLYDLKPIAGFKEYVIVYDSDDAGRKGAEKLARGIFKVLPNVDVMIAQWRNGLPDKYDVTDSFQNPDEIGLEFDHAVANASIYRPATFSKQGAFTVITGHEADKTLPKPTEWIIDTLLPFEFKTVLAGTTGSNKSYYALQEGMSIANNEDKFLGFKIHKKGLKVLYVDTEVGMDELLRRYHRVKRNFGRWTGSDRFKMMSKEGTNSDIWNDLVKVVEDYNPDVVYIDCLYNSTVHKDITKSHNVLKFTDRVTELKEKAGVTIRIIHHFNKGGHETGLTMERMSGATALQSWLEHIILMTSTNVPSLRMLRIDKARGVDYPREYFGLDWDPDKFQLSMIGVVSDWRKYLVDSNKIERWQQALERMPDEFETKDWLNVVVNELGLVKERQAKAWLKEMSIAKIIEDLKHGKWRKTEMKFVDDIIDME